jgi:trk system potassium uptake protein TrkA
LENSGGTIDLFVVPDDSPITNKTLKEITLPKDVLITAVKKGNKVIIPDGNTKLEPSDQVTILGKVEDVEMTIKKFVSDK